MLAALDHGGSDRDGGLTDAPSIQKGADMAAAGPRLGPGLGQGAVFMELKSMGTEDRYATEDAGNEFMRGRDVNWQWCVFSLAGNTSVVMRRKEDFMRYFRMNVASLTGSDYDQAGPIRSQASRIVYIHTYTYKNICNHIYKLCSYISKL